MADRVYLHSSFMDWAAYDRGRLTLCMNGGDIYHYGGVPECIFQGLLKAPSKGRYYNDNIKDRYYVA
jgi:hypothetical protein